MQLVEEYKEFVERDSKEISILWKIIQIFCYFLSAISGYCSSIIFYIFWEDIFGGSCPLWAGVYAHSTATVINSNNDYESNETIVITNFKNWLSYIVVRYDSETNCEIYFFTSLLSCTFGIIWIAMFSVCGKGGYNNRIIHSPWRIIVPALLFNFAFSILTLYATYELQAGYAKFRFDIQKVFSELTKRNEITYEMICSILQSYVEMYGVHGYNICNVFFILQILAWTMAWSWIFNLMLLVIRILLVTDFHILKVSVYEIPYNSIIPSSENDKDNIKTEPSENEKKKKN
ncbi:uncharacterized protein LOC118448286 [Vespa mandarinia]|uniref:uncharacterized protein LOC118448286 n=1 Tax=Vespa mandarinia TaxID=7446 RepID=UPI0016169416|nr:uncharacterized protein LOC118448286 [Vespa mandarinia]